MYNRKKTIIVVMMIAIMIMATGYAWFATSLNISTQGSISSLWSVYFASISEGTAVGTAENAITPNVSGTSATISVNLASPGDSMTYQLVLTNGGNVDAIIEEIKAVATGSSAIIYSITGISNGDKLASGNSIEITLKVEYDANVTSQPAETSKILTISVVTIQDTGQATDTETPEQPIYLSSTILQDNIAYADNVASPYVTSETGIDFSAISSDTNGKGLYYTSTNTEDNKTTYYFRGAVENNYVKFSGLKQNVCKYNGVIVGSYYSQEDGDEYSITTEEECLTGYVCQYDEEFYQTGYDESSCVDMGGIYTNEKAEYASGDLLWRIVRINEDGSVRIVTQDAVGNSAFNTNINDNAYVGYMYGTTGSNTYTLTHANTNDSTIKDYLDTWYENNLKTNYSSYLADVGFCNDRSIATTAGSWDQDDTALGYGTNYTYYGAYNRLEKEYQPQFACPNASNDLFTTGTSTKGNKALSNPIGLITADEAAYAGVAFVSNDTYYLYTGASYWTMSPWYFYGSYARANAGVVYSYGHLGCYDVDYDYVGVRPVVNLQSEVEITKGDGTKDNPYIIK